jgi:phage baseplate assembly protein gpV
MGLSTIMNKKQVAYIVTRTGEHGEEVPIGVFTNLDDASDSKDAWAQEFHDKGITEYDFEIHAVALYD